MGDIGMLMRILTGKLCAVHLRYFPSRCSWLPASSADLQMIETYHYDQIDAETEVYARIADPVGHSLSPLVHNVAFRRGNSTRCTFPSGCRGDWRFTDEAPALGVRGLSQPRRTKKTW